MSPQTRDGLKHNQPLIPPIDRPAAAAAVACKTRRCNSHDLERNLDLVAFGRASLYRICSKPPHLKTPASVLRPMHAFIISPPIFPSIHASPPPQGLRQSICPSSHPSSQSSRLKLHHPVSRQLPSTLPFSTPSAQTHLFVLSLYNTLCPHSLHLIGSPRFSGTRLLQSPHR